MNAFDVSRRTRSNLLQSIEHFGDDQLNIIPKDFKNNLIWHLGHVVVSQQLLCYGLSELPLLVEQDIVEKYRRGTKPEAVVDQAEIRGIKEMMFNLIDLTESDYQTGKFIHFNAYQSLYGLTLTNIDDAITFNNLHEALHLGYVLSIRKLL
jgi:hypothetical protein